MMMTGGEGCLFYDPHVPKHCPKQSDAEYRTEVSLYAVLSSPMMVGTDIRNMTAIMNELLLNADMLQINQDEKAPNGDKLASTCGGTDGWARHMSDGRVAVALPNLGKAPATLKVCGSDLGVTTPSSWKDVWGKKVHEPSAAFSVEGVGSHDTVLLIATPTTK